MPYPCIVFNCIPNWTEFNILSPRGWFAALLVRISENGCRLWSVRSIAAKARWDAAETPAVDHCLKCLAPIAPVKFSSLPQLVFLGLSKLVFKLRISDAARSKPSGDIISEIFLAVQKLHASHNLEKHGGE